MRNKAMVPNGIGRLCHKCIGAKTIEVVVKGQTIEKPCPVCSGTGKGGYVTK